MTDWYWQQFTDFTPLQLYKVLRLREAIFSIEQQASEPDIDGVDLTALHLLGYHDQSIVAYLRAYSKLDAIYLGRIVVSKQRQGQGIGKEMMIEAIRHLLEKYPDRQLKMSAQYYLESFYQSLGFVTLGDVYQEAGIDHVLMQFQK